MSMFKYEKHDGKDYMTLRIPVDSWNDNTYIKFAEKEYDKYEKCIDEKISSAKNDSEKSEIKNDAKYGRMVHESVIDLLAVLGMQGHSGMSYGFTIGEFRKLSNFKPIYPIEWDEKDWNYIYDDEDGNKHYQSKSCSAMFCVNLDKDTATYQDGIIFSDDGGKSWFTNKHSSIKVTFPFSVPSDAQRKIITEEDKKKMEEEDEKEYQEFLKRHPNYEKKISEKIRKAESHEQG